MAVNFNLKLGIYYIIEYYCYVNAFWSQQMCVYRD